MPSFKHLRERSSIPEPDDVGKRCASLAGRLEEVLYTGSVRRRTFMPLSSALRTILLLAGFFISTVADAQSPVEEIGPLPTTLTMEQLQLLQGLSNIPITETRQSDPRPRVPRFSFQALSHPPT